MGLDVGDRTIGVAISDPLGLTAQGITVIARSSLKKDLLMLKALVSEHGVGRLVIGLPRSLNNTLGPQAVKVQEFGEALKSSIALPVEFVDERYSTSVALRTLITADVSRQKRKGVIDKMAAQVILQSYLDLSRRKAKVDECDSGEIQ